MDPYEVENGRLRIIELYKSKEYPEPHVEILRGDRPEDVGVVYLIDEGRKQKVLATKFVGNTIASSTRLRSLVSVKPGFLYFIGGNFTRQRLDEDVAKLLEYYRGRSTRDYTIVNLMLRTGLRTIEVSRLNEGWIKEVNGRMRMQVWRKGMDRPNSRMTIGLPEKAWTPIRDYLQGRADKNPDAPLFLTEGRGGHRNRSHKGERMSTRLIQIIVKKGLRAIGLDDHEYSAHSLRHTCAVMMLNKGASMADIQRQLGHSSQKTTMIYLKSYERRIRMEACPAEILDDSFITEEP
jgi:integrase